MEAEVWNLVQARRSEAVIYGIGIGYLRVDLGFMLPESAVAGDIPDIAVNLAQSFASGFDELEFDVQRAFRSALEPFTRRGGSQTEFAMLTERLESATSENSQAGTHTLIVLESPNTPLADAIWARVEDAHGPSPVSTTLDFEGFGLRFGWYVSILSPPLPNKVAKAPIRPPRDPDSVTFLTQLLQVADVSLATLEAYERFFAAEMVDVAHTMLLRKQQVDVARVNKLRLLAAAVVQATYFTSLTMDVSPRNLLVEFARIADLSMKHDRIRLAAEVLYQSAAEQMRLEQEKASEAQANRDREITIIVVSLTALALVGVIASALGAVDPASLAIATWQFRAAGLLAFGAFVAFIIRFWPGIEGRIRTWTDSLAIGLAAGAALFATIGILTQPLTVRTNNGSPANQTVLTLPVARGPTIGNLFFPTAGGTNSRMRVDLIR